MNIMKKFTEQEINDMAYQNDYVDNSGSDYAMYGFIEGFKHAKKIIMSNAKPIFIIGMTLDTDQEEINSLLKNLGEQFNEEYHVFIYTSNCDSPTFQVFYEKDFNEVKYEELKAYINKKINEKQNKN